jgi:hypothetical protein
VWNCLPRFPALPRAQRLHPFNIIDKQPLERTFSPHALITGTFPGKGFSELVYILPVIDKPIPL